MLRGAAFLAVSLVILSTPVLAAEGFGQFFEEPINAPKSYSIIPDPTGAAPAPKVQSFTVSPGRCNDKKYVLEFGNGKYSDCYFKSIRSQLYEDVKAKQPKEAWYSWSMYLPAEFPLGVDQKNGGFYTFAYLHNTVCPNVALVSETATGSKLSLQVNQIPTEGKYYCVPDVRIDIADLASLRGAWHHYEMFVRFSEGDDGMAEVYIDGKRVGVYHGHTITVGAPSKNYFKYGIYLCCTQGTEGITKATAYYARIKRSTKRDGGGETPVAPVANPDFVIHVSETQADKTGRDPMAASNFVGTVKGRNAPPKLQFLINGPFDFGARNFDGFDILLLDPLGKVPPDFAKCVGQRIEQWDDGPRAVIRYDRIEGKNFIARGAECITAALPKKLSNQAAFLLAHFHDIAASMVADGTAELIKHEGVKVFIERVAANEIEVRM